MDKEYLKDSKDIAYADLSQGETEKLKELERTFNSEFQCDYYLMVMKDHSIKS
ncbi:polynucleotide phosphorylase [Clostridium tagluense]|uniref:polynucleotide phosphorylase n=1 Tax=Clostridium TaxID=1485 RepID=UPI0013E90033|nr:MULTISPECIES: polynucleotide phosphorylase [Clostridium]MBU3128116.1 polynucleotide phosphorylase [Clostridium tagluense]MBZ9625004.1 polynucleotide phosphorylase [Clostridium sp. FP2]MCB2311747.1 polynucleotide phosphorylase [Clostridium tagluense]MCB2316531.1 polynucleotide phosphorylase [Clostridium tagluense]MCB2321327.1 polynucleotide phosphorylase [Clostridium tagluense]